ncbi:MAG: hypothetical protein LUB61_01985 [Eggerthellaceae bacterium]|nr:hypothetical protein [Eggerthellaceae bacterium]
MIGIGIAYLSAGRIWNVAASVVDDTVGSMDGYTVVIYDGTAKDDEEGDGHSDVPEWLDSASALNNDANESEESADENLDELLSLDEITVKDKVYLSDIRSAYSEKGASVVTINTLDKTYYQTPALLFSEGRTLGIFNINNYASKAHIKSIVESLRIEGADTIICICERTSMLATDEGIDVVLITEDEGLSDLGTYAGNCLVVQSPDIGEVGAIVISSENVCSARILN